MSDTIAIETCRHPVTKEITDRWFPVSVPAGTEIMKVLTGEITDEAKVQHINKYYRLIVVEVPVEAEPVETGAMKAEDIDGFSSTHTISVSDKVANCSCTASATADSNSEIRIWVVAHFAEHMQVQLS